MTNNNSRSDSGQQHGILDEITAHLLGKENENEQDHQHEQKNNQHDDATGTESLAGRTDFSNNDLDDQHDKKNDQNNGNHKDSEKRSEANENRGPVAQYERDLQKRREHERSDDLVQSIEYWQEDDSIPKHLREVKRVLKEVVGLGESFDVILREMTFGEHNVGIFYLNGFAKDEVMTMILARLTMLDKSQLSSNALRAFFECYIPHIQVEKVTKLSEAINKVLAGGSAFFIEHERTALIADVKTFPGRGPDEPSLERVVRGARDGFTETLLTNVSLVRRRLRDPGLKYEMVQVGRRTRTDVCIAYIDDVADLRLVESVRNKIKKVNLAGLPLADKQLEEAIINKGWNPYPLVRYSERPDSVAAHLMDGSVVLFVDTSPSVMILPTTFFDLCQHAEENRQTPFIGTYLRAVRFIGIFASLFLLPLWLLLVMQPELKPAFLQIVGPHENAKLPIILQFLLAELGIDLLRMAAVHTPTPLATAIGLVAAILLGDIAVQTGVFVNEVILYMSVAAIGMFATPSYELSLANRIIRLVLLVAVAAFKVPGFVIGTTLYIVWLAIHRSYNSSYLWPFIPFNAKAMLNILIRRPLLDNKDRPSFNKTKDSTKMRSDKTK
ncbi:spore germination protein [Paenibacillus sp. 1001270B_150601_E10]|uniref:spore germination protein n=1 Tax=Paenibacillus sp. 1001270B_150601_E10 TaxID=2787079 RepID=UPI00189FF94F|nr:spore germination protein [Paenibacillus sp. 1001270B_150601_E10]